MSNFSGQETGMFVHIVGDLQYWLDRLGLKVPRGLCGELLAGDSKRPDVNGADAPVCPECAQRAGWTQTAATAVETDEQE